jgi:hypothetical protein
VTEPAGASSTDLRLGDPLSDVTRKTRLYLLGASTVGVTIVFTGLVPSEIRALGITFARADRRSLLFILSLVIAYFLMAFIIYAASDFLEWRSRLRAATLGQMVERELGMIMGEGQMEDQAPFAERERQARFAIQRQIEGDLRSGSLMLFRFTGAVSFLRGLFEFGLPVLYGIIAVVVLLFRAPPPAG